MSRLSKEDYLWSFAFTAAKRGTCDRFRGGCVVVRDGLAVATGYNGSAPNEPHCDEAGHELEYIGTVANDVGKAVDLKAPHCVRTIHAEINAVINAAYLGVSIARCDWYLAGVPCRRCYRILTRLKPARIFFCSDKPDTYTEEQRLDITGKWKEMFRNFGFPILHGVTLAELQERGVC